MNKTKKSTTISFKASYVLKEGETVESKLEVLRREGFVFEFDRAYVTETRGSSSTIACISTLKLPVKE